MNQPASNLDQSTKASFEEKRKNEGVRMLRMALLVIGGAVAGFAYYRFVGCRTGTCPISSNPVISTLYGALMGFLLAR